MNEAPLQGRRFYFVGIGGAGLSAYANFARAWGAEVRGWDVQETRFLETLDGVEVDLGGEPMPPDGFEVVLSAAHAGRSEGRTRADFLAELVALRRSIVVGGAHGKTTTAAMIAYVLRELGEDPAWIIGGVVRQLGGNAGTGNGWLVVEGDESDRSIGLLRPEIAVVTNVELDHHAAFSSTAELQAFLDEWAAAAQHVVRGWELEPVSFDLAVPGEHNRLNAAAAVAALEYAEVAPGRCRARSRRLPGRRPATRAGGRSRRHSGLRRLRAQPDGDRGDVADGPRARGLSAPRRVPAARVRADAAASRRARRGARAGGPRGRDGDRRRPGSPTRGQRQARPGRRSCRECAAAGHRRSTRPRRSRSHGCGPATSS